MIRTTLLAFILFVGFNASAQKPFTFGPFVGISSSTLENSAYTASKANTGYGLGAFVRLDIKKWYLQPNIYYLQNASSFEDNQTTTDAKLKSVNYEALLGYRIFKFTDLTYLRIFTGVGYANINSMKYKSNNPSITSDAGNSNTTFNIGGGLDFWKFTFDLKYQRGLTDIDDSSNKQFTNMLFLTAGFKIL